MKKNHQLLIFGTLLILAACLRLAFGPNEDLQFTRDVVLRQSPNEALKSLSNPTLWPTWHHSVSRVTYTPPLSEGSELKFWIAPHGLRLKSYAISAKVLHFNPKESVTLLLLEDQSGKLTRLFDRLEWKVELKKSESPAAESFGHTETVKTGQQAGAIPQAWLVRGTVLAHTAHWRSRLFGNLTPKILLNQVFLPDLLKLASPDEKSGQLELTPQ